MAKVFKRHGKYYIGFYFESKRFKRRIGLSLREANRQKKIIEGEIEKKKFPSGFTRNTISFVEFVEKFWNLYGKYKRGTSFPYMIKRVKEEFCYKKLSGITVSDCLVF